MEIFNWKLFFCESNSTHTWLRHHILLNVIEQIQMQKRKNLHSWSWISLREECLTSFLWLLCNLWIVSEVWHASLISQSDPLCSLAGSLASPVSLFITLNWQKSFGHCRPGLYSLIFVPYWQWDFNLVTNIQVFWDLASSSAKWVC